MTSMSIQRIVVVIMPIREKTSSVLFILTPIGRQVWNMEKR
jgi:hypothetical protein